MAGKRRRVTVTDIASEAGVGVATVDRVLNGRAKVSPATAARVLAAAEKLNYHGQPLLRRRINELAPPKTLGFILQKESKWFYQSLSAALEQAASELSVIQASSKTAFVGALSPTELTAAIERMSHEADALAVVSIDHHAIANALETVRKQGRPVFAVLSPLSTPALSGYVGINGRKAGRTAGWAMSRLAKPGADVGILVGSHRYLGHEALETGFRSYMRQAVPTMQLRDSLIYLDDSAVAYEAASELLRLSPDMAGLYHCGGGSDGVIRALREAGRGQHITYICHDLAPRNHDALHDGTVDLVISTPLEPLARTLVSAMADALLGSSANLRPLPFDLLTPENL